MPIVHEMAPGLFSEIEGNPVILSLDGEVQAPLQTILAPSWTEEDRAKFGIYVVEPATIPEGMMSTGVITYSRDVNGKVVQNCSFIPSSAVSLLLRLP